jgi:DNA-binding transcriptional LysR family regulator
MDILSVDLMDVQAFFTVADTGSFARAAERLNSSKSIISRRVARLEERLKARLLTRTPKGAQTTDVGALYYARAKEALGALECAGEEVAHAVSDVSGPIRITGPLSFGISHLGEALSEFAAAYPLIELDISLSDYKVDVIQGGYDVAIRIGQLADSSLIARKLGRVHAVTVASPDYLSRLGRPEHPDDLPRHQGLYYANLQATEMWRYRVDGKPRSVKVPVRLRADNGDMLLKAALHGLGIARIPAFLAEAAIQSGRLEVLLADFDEGFSPISALMPPGRAMTARVRALVDFLATRFSGEVL